MHGTRSVPADPEVSAGDSSGEDMDISQDDLSDEEIKEDDDGSDGLVGAATQPRWGGET